MIPSNSDLPDKYEGGDVWVWGRADEILSFSGHGDEGEEGGRVVYPRLLSGVSSARRITLGGKHACVVSEGNIFSWGQNNLGQLGFPDLTSRVAPSLVKTLALTRALRPGVNYVDVAAGSEHSVALTSDGKVYTWGTSPHGQLGDGTSGRAHPSPLPSLLLSLHDVAVRQIACGGTHSLALSADGRVFAWGRGANGRLGLGHERDCAKPEQVPRLEDVHTIACGWSHSMAISAKGRLYIWGKGEDGLLGLGDDADRNRPTWLDVAGFRIRAASGGYYHSAAITAKGHLFTWGWGEYGQLGHGDTQSSNRPQRVKFFQHPLRQVSCGGFHTIALCSSGQIYTWGGGEHGQLGHGDNHSRAFPRSLDFDHFHPDVKPASSCSLESMRPSSSLESMRPSSSLESMRPSSSSSLEPTHPTSSLESMHPSSSLESMRESPSSSSNMSLATEGCSSPSPFPHHASPQSAQPSSSFSSLSSYPANALISPPTPSSHHSSLPPTLDSLPSSEDRHLPMDFSQEDQFPFFGKVYHIAGGWWHSAALIAPLSTAPPQGLENFKTPHSTVSHSALELDSSLAHCINPAHLTPRTPTPGIDLHTDALADFNPSAILFEDSKPLPANQSDLQQGDSPIVPSSEFEGSMDPIQPAGSPTLTRIRSLPELASQSEQITSTPQMSRDDTTSPLSSTMYTPSKSGSTNNSPRSTLVSTSFSSWITRLFSSSTPPPATGLISSSSPSLSRSKIERSDKMLRLERVWLSQVLPDLSSRRNDPETRELCMQGIPPHVRGQVWPRLIGNQLKITPELFADLQKQALTARRAQALLDETGARQSKIQVIDGDLPRTFSNWKLFHEDGPFYRELQQILETYDLYQPSPGYVQGMSYLAATLLVHMDQYHAFVCFTNLMSQSFFQDLFKMDIPRILKHLQIYELLFSKHLPTLFNEIVKVHEISAEIYLLDWFLTAFTKTLPFHIATRVWDGFLLEGEIFLFRTAISILKVSKSKLKNASFEKYVSILRNLPRDVDEEELFKNIQSITIPIYVEPLLHSLTDSESNEK